MTFLVRRFKSNMKIKRRTKIPKLSLTNIFIEDIEQYFKGEKTAVAQSIPRQINARKYIWKLMDRTCSLMIHLE